MQTARGIVVALTDTTGNEVDRYAYDVWGQPTSESDNVQQRLRYAGYWYDQELGWYWVSVRLYDPNLKRWLQPDPSQQDGVRTYVYVGDDPIDVADPSGMDGYPPAVPLPTPNPVSTPTPPTATPTPSAGSGGGRVTIQVSIQGGVAGNGATGDGGPP